MEKKKPVVINGRAESGEVMIWSPEFKSLRRGRRVAPRTEVCRPCLVWNVEIPDIKMAGVVLDLNPHGLRVRLVEEIALQTIVAVQMMRDEEFTIPLSPPINARVVRVSDGFGGLTDHGMQVVLQVIQRQERRPVTIQRTKPRRFARTRMHTLDITVGDRDTGRYGRRRG